MSARDRPEVSLFATLRIDRDRPVSDLDRFIALALPSFHARLSADVVREIVLVVPTSDVKEVTARLRQAAEIPFRVIDEHDLANGIDGLAGWIKQQILKISAPAVIATPWFITLDADVVATRAVDREFLVPGGRAIWEREPAIEHMEWWQASARLLDVQCTISPTTPVFGVTPAILHTESVRGLAAAIERAHPGRAWVQTLVEHHDFGWTEYTLYWTHLLAAGLANKFYSDVARIPHALKESVWTADDLNDLDLAAVFAPDADHAFFVFQSNLEQPLEETVRMLRPYIDGNTSISAEERQRWSKHFNTSARGRGGVGWSGTFARHFAGRSVMARVRLRRSPRGRGTTTGTGCVSQPNVDVSQVKGKPRSRWRHGRPRTSPT